MWQNGTFFPILGTIKTGPSRVKDLKAYAWQPGTGQATMFGLWCGRLGRDSPRKPREGYVKNWGRHNAQCLPVWKQSGPMLSAGCAHVGPSRAHVEPSWAHLGPMLAQVGPMLGPSWAHVGPMLGPRWPMLGLCWPMLPLGSDGLCWAYVGPCWGVGIGIVVALFIVVVVAARIACIVCVACIRFFPLRAPPCIGRGRRIYVEVLEYLE